MNLNMLDFLVASKKGSYTIETASIYSFFRVGNLEKE